MAPFFIGLLSVLLGIVSVLIVLIVLMQRPKQEGLGAAFGGGMKDQMFGAQTTNVLQKGTVYLAVMFFLFALIISVLTAKSVREDSDAMDQLKKSAAVEIEEPDPLEGIPAGSSTTKPVQIPTIPAGEKTPAKTPAVEKPAVEKPAVETPAVETPAVETPAVETPAVETPAVEPPAVEPPAVEAPAVDPAVDPPAVIEEEKPAEVPEVPAVVEEEKSAE